jgi:hypothetical protein
MALPRLRRAAMAAVAAGVLALTACGSKPSDVTVEPTGQGQLGDAPSATPSPTADGTPAATTTTGGGGGGGTTSPYPSSAKDYGLEILKAIANNNDARIVDLSSLSTAQYVQQQNYKSKNGQWTYTDCQSGSTQSCHYYNQTGDTAQVGIETAKLGTTGAASSVTIDGGSFATQPGPYVGAFGSAWEAGDYAKMVSLSSTSIANHFNTLPKFSSVNAGITYSGPGPCPAPNAAKTCVALQQVGGTATLPARYLIVDVAKIGAGKPNGIIGYV